MPTQGLGEPNETGEGEKTIWVIKILQMNQIQPVDILYAAKICPWIYNFDIM